MAQAPRSIPSGDVMRVKQSGRVRLAIVAAAPLAVSGCALDRAPVLAPQGLVALDKRNLLFAASAVMLIVVIPVIAMIFWFACRYRASNHQATYVPEWAHLARIEAVVWFVPTLIVVLLGVLVWNYSNKLDPFRPIRSHLPPLEVQAVAQGRKWLFIYPEQNIAVVNELVFPSGRPVNARCSDCRRIVAFESQPGPVRTARSSISVRADEA
jgi:cytochrome o ubiquinol oxidase subunit 2